MDIAKFCFRWWLWSRISTLDGTSQIFAILFGEVHGATTLDMFGYDVKRYNPDYTDNSMWIDSRSHEAYAKVWSFDLFISLLLRIMQLFGPKMNLLLGEILRIGVPFTNVLWSKA